MPIHNPGKRLLHKIPLKFVRNRVAGGGRKAVDVSIALIPFIDFLIVLVVFLLTSFSATGELLAQKPSITMPGAENVATLEPAPVIAIDDKVITLDGRRVGDTNTLMESADASERIPQLTQDLGQLKRNWSILHPQEPFEGTFVLQADQGIDFRVIKKVVASAAEAGYFNVSFAVNRIGED